MRHSKTWLCGLVILVLAAGIAAPEAEAKRLDEAEFFIEINATDGDAGIQVFLDGVGWKRMKIFDPDGNKIVDTKNRNSVKQQGITEFFFESAEPSFDVQTLEELMALFPEGRYRFEGVTTEGEPLTGKTKLTHDFPMQPMQVSPVDGESVDPENAVFTWVQVADPPGSEIVTYEVVLECEEPEFTKATFLVGPDVDSITVGPEFLEQEDLDECKWEVLAKEDSGNQTISETEFSID
ncbi:MAG: hypothetical protein ACE5GX_08035 [Thermoanaerobaculia bacterium]